MGRTPIKNKIQKKRLNPSARTTNTQPRSPKRPEKKKPRKVRQISLENSPLSTATERRPLKRKTLPRESRRSSVLDTTMSNSYELHSGFGNKRISTLLFGSIMNAFKMVPKGKKPASPRLQLAPLNKSRTVKLRGGDKTVHSTRRPRG